MLPRQSAAHERSIHCVGSPPSSCAARPQRTGAPVQLLQGARTWSSGVQPKMEGPGRQPQASPCGRRLLLSGHGGVVRDLCNPAVTKIAAPGAHARGSTLRRQHDEMHRSGRSASSLTNSINGAAK